MLKIDDRKTRLITGDLQKDLIQGIEMSKTIYLLSAFVMKSGVQLLYSCLKEAAERGADIKILTGDYLFVTQPEALELISMLPDSVEVRLWQGNGRSFHPKAFIFEKEDDGALIVGSSNLSRSALTHGVEWNLFMDQSVSETTLEEAQKHFIGMFYADNTMPVNPETVKSYRERYESFHRSHPDLVHNWTWQEEIGLTLGDEKPDQVAETAEAYTPEKTVISPRFAQPDALAALSATLEEGYNKAMVVMATGLGKTYLAAFFAEQFERVLFIAHREEILHQAKQSFLHVMPDKTAGIYDGRTKEAGDFIFASIFTLSRKKHLEHFNPRDFDLVIIDEFHHASAKSYQNVIQYFEPDFMMGITATPERADGHDIFALCDGNVAYEMNFIQAIQKGWLSPFQYYGVYDDIDYSSITWLGNGYDEEELARRQLQEGTARNILENWEKYKQTRTIGFCSSVRQADFLAGYFSRNGYKAVSLHSRSQGMSRREAIRALAKRELDAIFTVDLFNEGVDIPAVDTLLFVRPTESLVVFTQQIGRGLRKYDGKSHCTIIDMIGNYRNAETKLNIFGMENTESGAKRAMPVVPDTCEIHLETKAIELVEELLKKKSPRKERVFIAYNTVKEELGRRPSYWEAHLHSSENSKEFRQIWNSYAGFLAAHDELHEKEAEVYKTYRSWIEECERTTMSKSYKMVILKFMLARGPERWMDPFTPEDAAPFFHGYFMEKPYRKRTDFSSKNTKALWDYNETKVAKLVATMPLTMWSGSSKGLLKLENNIFGATFDVVPEDSAVLHALTSEICEYRLKYYFEKRVNKD